MVFIAKYAATYDPIQWYFWFFQFQNQSKCPGCGSWFIFWLFEWKKGWRCQPDTEKLKPDRSFSSNHFLLLFNPPNFHNFPIEKILNFFYLGSSHFYQFFRVFNKTCKICEAKRLRITPEGCKHYMIQQYEELMLDLIGQFKMSSYIAVNISAILTIDQ